MDLVLQLVVLGVTGGFGLFVAHRALRVLRSVLQPDLSPGARILGALLGVSALLMAVLLAGWPLLSSALWQQEGSVGSTRMDTFGNILSPPHPEQLRQLDQLPWEESLTRDCTMRFVVDSSGQRLTYLALLASLVVGLIILRGILRRRASPSILLVLLLVLLVGLLSWSGARRPWVDVTADFRLEGIALQPPGDPETLVPDSLWQICQEADAAPPLELTEVRAGCTPADGGVGYRYGWRARSRRARSVGQMERFLELHAWHLESLAMRARLRELDPAAREALWEAFHTQEGMPEVLVPLLR